MNVTLLSTDLNCGLPPIAEMPGDSVPMLPTEPPSQIDTPVFVVPPFPGWDNLATVQPDFNPNQLGQPPVDFNTPLGTPDYSGVPHDFSTVSPGPQINLGPATISSEGLAMIPEPSTVGLIVLGFGLVMISARFRKQNTRTV